MMKYDNKCDHQWLHLSSKYFELLFYPTTTYWTLFQMYVAFLSKYCTPARNDKDGCYSMQ